jgi:nitrile hydratase subunit beta
MNTAHDLGGMQGFGPIPEIALEIKQQRGKPRSHLKTNELPDEQANLFHGDWEKRVLAITLAMGACGLWNIDQSRAARESMPPPHYLNSSYFEIWYAGLSKLLLQRGLVTQQELDTGLVLKAALHVEKILKVDQVALALAKGSPTNRGETSAAKFKIGDRVTTLLMNPNSHTRLPRYARGKSGVIHLWHGAHVFPDVSSQFDSSNPNGAGSMAHHLYTVEFKASELWGEHTTASAVFVDCWEPYFA